MSTNTAELSALISKAQAMGAIVKVDYDAEALIEEGRDLIDTVTVSGIKGCGPYPMGPIAAAERLRELMAEGCA